MRSKYSLCTVLAITLAVVLAGPQSLAQEKKKLTAETMSDPTLYQGSSLPRTWWLKDNTAVLYDVRKPDSIRTLERLDPKTGKRTPMLDRTKAGESFKKLFPEGKAPRFSPVPNELDESGKYGLYLISGDIFVLDIAKAVVMRVTETKEEEKSPGFSPDGSKLAFVRENNLYSYDIEQKLELQLTTDGSETLLNGTLSWVYWEEIFGRRDAAYWWSGDSRAIAYLQSDESGVSLQQYIGIEPWTPKVTTQRYPKVGEKNPEVRIGVVELETQKTTWADIDRAKYEYVIRVDWWPDSKRYAVRVMNRLQTELDMYFVERKTGAAQFVLKDTDEGWINMSEDLYFLKDRKSFVMSSERSGYAHLYRFSLGGALVNQITKGEWALCNMGPGPFWVRRAITGIDEEGGWIYFGALEKSSLERHLYRIKMDGSKMERLTKEDGVHSVTMSPDAKYYFDRFSSSSSPPSLVLCDAKGSKKLALAEPDFGGLVKYDVSYPELFTIPARDGFQMPASLTKPIDFDPNKKYPVIFNVYGGPSAPTVSNSFSFGVVSDNVLANQGYILVRVDNRAATAISKKLENLLLHRYIGEVELNDYVDAARWMKKQPYVDPERLGITGWSNGGSITLLMMTRSQEFRAGIAGAGVTDFRFYDSKWGEAAMKTDEVNLKGYEENSLLKFAKDLNGKLMIVHGTHDDNVHIQNSWRFINELIKANKLFELVVYPLRGHGVGDPAGSRHLRSATFDFWERNLKGD